MDRVTTYFDAIPLETDILRTGQYAMVGLGKLAEATLGTSAVVAGFTLTPTSPASLSVILGPGQVFQQQNLEATPVSSLPVDSHTIVKQGVLLDSVTQTITPPTTVGYSQNFLIEVQYADADVLPVTLPYYNASNPDVQYNGPGGNGSTQSTARKGAVAYQVKAGIAATSGSQTIPTPDAGWVGLYVVTVAYGATTITAGNITPYAPSSFLPSTLPGVPAGVQSGKWVFGVASGTNAYAVTLFSTNSYPVSLVAGMEITVYFGNANTASAPTLNVNNIGAAPLKKQYGGTPLAGDVYAYMSLIYDGANWLINGLLSSDIHVRLNGSTTFYVAPTGNDSNPGTSSAPWLTLQGAWNNIQKNFDLGGNAVTVQVADGTYTSGLIGAGQIIGQASAIGLTFQGGVNAIINPPANSAFVATNYGQFSVNGFTLYGAGTGLFNGYCLFANQTGLLTFTGCKFMTATAGHISATSGGIIGVNGNYTIAGNAPIHYQTSFGGSVIVNASTIVTLSGTPAFSTGFCVVAASFSQFTSLTFSGSATGTRYSITLNGVAFTNSGGGTYFPGSVAGATGTGGQYA